MKSFIRKILVNSLALLVLTQILAGVRIAGGIEGLVISAIVLTLISWVVKPILNIVGIPIKVISFGLFPLLVNAVLLYLLSVLVAQVSITAFFFQGFSFGGFIIPRIFFNSVFAFLAASVIFSTTVFLIDWVTD